MLPRNIDLTANSDFGIGGGIFMDTPIEIPINEYNLMTHEQYDKLMWWEGIFGRKRYYMDKSKIFNKEWSFIEKYKHECQRCGKKIIVPWKNIYGLCKECDEIVSHNSKKIPWKISRPVIRRIGDRGQGDLFDLR